MRFFRCNIAVYALLLAAASSLAQAPEPFIIRAQLVDADDKPMPGETALCVIHQDGKTFFQLEWIVKGEIIGPGGPKGVTDKAGNVEIVVDGEFIEKNRKEFSIGVVRNSKVIPVLKDGRLFYFTIDDARQAGNKLHLGKMTLKIN